MIVIVFLPLKKKSSWKNQSFLDVETEYYSLDKKLIIGGIILEEKYQKAFGPFKARCDGDVLYHAVVNTLLSALGNKQIRDIGTVFPNTDKPTRIAIARNFWRRFAYHALHAQKHFSV